MSDWTPRGTRQINLRAGALTPALEARSTSSQSLGQTAARDLERYYALLATTLARIDLSTGEASLIVDALNGTLTEPHTASLLWAQIADALDDGLAEKWEVDGTALVARLRQFTPFEALAVADAAERFWNSTQTQPEMFHGDRLRLVGLVR